MFCMVNLLLIIFNMIRDTRSIGIDVSKATLDICLAQDINILDNTKVRKCDNSAKGVEKFIKFLEQKRVSKQAPIIIESTGDYHILVTTLLLESGYNVKLVNPLIVRQYAKSNIRKQKSDRTDSRLLAKIGILQPKLTDTPSFKRNLILARKKVALINRLKKQSQAMKRRYKVLLDLYTQLKEAPQMSLFAIKQSMDSINTAIEILEEEVSQEMKEVWEVESMTKIKGVSRESSSQVCAVLKGRKFDNKKQLVAYFGLDVGNASSGTSIRKNGRLTKRGNPAIRRILFNVAWGLCRHNPKFQNMYNYYKKKGRHHFECLIIIARKFLHMLYGMWKTKSNFNINLLQF